MSEDREITITLTEEETAEVIPGTATEEQLIKFCSKLYEEALETKKLWLYRGAYRGEVTLTLTKEEARIVEDVFRSLEAKCIRPEVAKVYWRIQQGAGEAIRQSWDSS